MARVIHLVLVGTILAGCQVSAARPVADAVDPAVALGADSGRSAEWLTRATPTGAGTTSLVPTERPTVRPTMAPTPTPTPPPAAFAYNLYEEGDFVQQYTFEWCVAASIQMAYNMVAADRRTARDDQSSLWEQARARSSNSFNGANPYGWASVMNEIGIGPYKLVSIPDYSDALRVAAKAMRETERSVGLVMWRGRHAWVMSGFESIGDPAIHTDFEVTGVRVLDPLYPYGSGQWGPSPEPNTLMAPAELATQFVIREPRRWSSDLEAGYLLVLPVDA